MPLPIYLVGFVLPVACFIEILRRVVLRGADLLDLVPHIFGLFVCCGAILTLSVTRFRKRLDRGVVTAGRLRGTLFTGPCPFGA